MAKTNITPIQTSPRTMQRDDRRRIADYLEGEIDQNKSCYKGSGSDVVSAEALKVPCAWVKEVREQLFCDDDKNEMSGEANEKLDALLARVSDLATLFNDEATSIRKEIEVLRKKLS